MADAQHTTTVRELTRLTLDALKGVEHPAATEVDNGVHTAQNNTCATPLPNVIGLMTR